MHEDVSTAYRDWLNGKPMCSATAMQSVFIGDLPPRVKNAIQPWLFKHPDGSVDEDHLNVNLLIRKPQSKHDRLYKSKMVGTFCIQVIQERLQKYGFEIHPEHLGGRFDL